MPDGLLTTFNQLRKKRYFNSLYQAKKKYAFVGIGMHSLTNLYPILHYLGVSLKYICTKTSSGNRQLSQLFPMCHFTNTLDDIANDSEVEGVFVCASPYAHYGILTTLLKSGKKIFVEKPPCFDSLQLENLVKISEGKICKVGLQRAYWPGNKFVMRKIKSANSYNYQFHFGHYIHGDPFTELFIHALHYCNYLFGEYKLKSFTRKKDPKGITVQMHVLHSNSISGLIELSTHFSWRTPKDHMSIRCDNEVLTIEYPTLVKGEKLPTRIFNLPAERLLDQPIVTKEYFSIGNLIMPVMELNTLVLQGFFSEVDEFIKLTEGINSSQIANDLSDLRSVYEIIDMLKQ